jgi:hypothetical protein
MKKTMKKTMNKTMKKTRKKEDEVLKNFYFKVYKLIVKDRGILSELYNQGLDCSVIDNLRTEPVVPKKELKAIMPRMGMNETQILEIHLKKVDPEQYADISREMGYAYRGFRSLEKSNRLNPSEKKQLLKISERIYETYKDNLWKWYVEKFNADSGAHKDIRTAKQAEAWLAHKLFDYIKPFKEKANMALGRQKQKDIPKRIINGLIADIMNHGKKRNEKLTTNKVKWYIENYEKIKT